MQGKLLARYDIKVTLKTNLSYSFFPFESHVLQIALDNNFVTPGDVVFESSNNEFGVSSEVAHQAWCLKNVSINSGFSSAPLEKDDPENVIYHPRLIFSLY